MDICRASLYNFSFRIYRSNLARIVQEFDSLPITNKRKPRIGVVGEILVKFHPGANNHIVELIEQEGAEAAVPDILDFFLYCSYGPMYKGQHLGKSKLGIAGGRSAIYFLEQFRKPLKDALLLSKRFTAPLTIFELADKASRLLSIGNQAGEGWFLTAEMMELIESGVTNIACIQPFACLPNHVTGRGMLKGLKELYPAANITAIDYDASETEVNQINRLKLMLATAFKIIERAGVNL
jgi:predicted nucleotide-binding protein (sugar kinase/HSP70/actin superfamily)